MSAEAGGRFQPVDEEARHRVRRDHLTSFVLEAGAGTGKTTLLVDRIECLVKSGAARLTEIAAVTFTENAATTMKLRLRDRLERARVDALGSADERQRAAEALEVLERAQVSTLHALCAALIGERPLECGVPPGFRQADEAEADLLFAEAWDDWLAERLVEGDQTLLLALEAEIPLEGAGPWGERTSLRGLARTLIEQRDLQPLVADTAADPAAWNQDLQARAAAARALVSQVEDGDTLGGRLGILVSFAEQARFLQGEDLKRHLGQLAVITRTSGFRPRWATDEALEEGRRIAEWTREASTAWKQALSAELHGRLVRALADVGARYARKKSERGVLDFLDLLLVARNALRDRAAVRRYFRDRFRFLIVDEFQDTDPLQVEIARALTSEAPGALVVVGDAKQSIYRFRRAEVALFRRISEEAARTPGMDVLHLTQNFRSRPAILRFVNRAFGELIKPSEEADQPPYEPIAPPPGLTDEPSVISLRFPASLAHGEELLRAEATALVAWLAHVAGGGETVRDLDTGAPRPSRAGDVMVLVRRLTQVRHLEEAMEAAGLRFSVEGGKSFFDRQEVHEVLSVLRAVEDPSDRVSLVAALRSSFFGVSDRDLASYVLAGGGLWLGPVDADKPGAEALAPALRLLDTLYRDRTRLTVPALVERLYEETRILAAFTGTRRGEAQIANLEKVATLARQAADLGVLTVRGFAALLQHRIETARDEPDLPTTRPGDAETIRVLSIHKAKGLEAPVVALFDSADDPRFRPETVPLWEQGCIAVGFRQGCQPPGWELLTRREEARAWAEARRLLYVACTRARDLLLVPCPPKDARPGGFWKELTAFLPPQSDADVRVVDTVTLPMPERESQHLDMRRLAAARGGDAVAARWETEREGLLQEAAHRPLQPVSVTRAAARSAPVPVALVPSRGEAGGRDFGSLVHRILEWIPLEEDGGAAPLTEAVPAMAAALAPAFGVDDDGARRAAETALRALALPVMQRARRATRLWRELALWFPEGDELVEGVVDLVFEEEGGLVVVDYKTDRIGTEQALAQAAHHAPQLQLYGRGLAQASGLPVRERLVLFTAVSQVIPV